MRALLEIFLISMVLAALNFAFNSPIDVSKTITFSGISEIPNPIIYIDARSPKEFSESSIPGAINLSEEHFYSQIGDLLERWSPGTTIVVYCDPKNCDSSQSIYVRLKDEYGISNIFILKGDWREWKN